MEELNTNKDNNTEISEPETPETGESETPDKARIKELNDKYLRLYAEFDNYKKKVNKDKEELAKYANESLAYELLPVIDSLELALKHASEDPGAGVVQGVEMTLKELRRTLEKFGIVKIESEGKEFDPSIHHAMSQIEREDLKEKMVALEMRPGYLYRDKVLRPALVAVSVRPQVNTDRTETGNNKSGNQPAENRDKIRITANENKEEEQ